MKQPKLLSLLETLSMDTFQRFRRYLQFVAPRSNQFPLVLDFLAEIHPHYHKFKGDLLAQIEQILRENGTENMNNKMRGNSFSRLYAELEDFLALEQLKKNENIKHLLTLQALREHSTAELYNNALEEAIGHLAKQKNLSAEHNHAQLQVLHEAYFNTLKNKYRMPGFGLDHLQAAWEQLHLFYRKLQLKYRLELEDGYRVVRSNLDQPEATDRQIVGSDIFVDPYIQLLQMIEALHQDPTNEALFWDAVKLYRQELPKLKKEDQTQVLRFLKNAVAALIRNGSSLQTLRISFELADLGWRNNLFSVLGGYTAMNFLNFVEIAVSLNEVTWLEEFIQNAIPKVPKNEREDIKALALANLLFAQKNYAEALSLLNTTKSLDTQLELRLRMLQCKICFETQDTDLLINKLKSFDVYLHRSSTFQAEIIQGYTNFLKLLRLIADPYKSKYEKFNKLLPLTTPLYGRIWLEQQSSPKK